MPGEDLLGLAKRAGYLAGAISEVVAQTDGTPATIVAFWHKRGDSVWEDVVSERHRDLGIGVSSIDGVPLYVLFFGVTSGDTFAQRTAAIRDRDHVRRELLAAANRERSAHRLPPLRANPLLEQAAQGHADDMLARGFYGHASPEGAMALERVRRAGYPARIVGENIAKGQTTVAGVMEDWMRSREHRKNLLDPLFRDTGFGVALGKTSGGEQVLWVQVFGQSRVAIP